MKWPILILLTGLAIGQTIKPSAIQTKSLNSIKFADQFTGADIGAKVNAAIAALPTVSGYATGTIYLNGFSPTATQSTKVTITSPFLSIIGPGSGALQITCTLNDNCWDVHISPFVIYPGLVVKGFSVIGQGTTNANANGLHIGDVVGANIEDLAIDNFRGTNSACVWVDNINGFFERNTLQHINAGLAQTSQQGCTKNWRFTNTATTLASSSFGHNHFIHNKLSVAGGQTGISIESGAVYDSTFDFTGNAITGTTATMLAISGTTYSGGGGAQLDGAISFPVECTSPCSAGTLISSGAGTTITIRSGIGFYDSSGLLSTTGTGNLTRDLNSGLNNAAIPESIQIKASPVTGNGLSYFILPQPPVSTRSITLSDPGGSDTFAWVSATQSLSGKTLVQPTVTTGINQGSGLKHQRFSGVLGGTCPTAAGIGAACTSGNLNWTTAFADNNYTVTCSLMGSMTGQPHIVSLTQQAAGAGITITIAADTAAAANVAAAGFVDCIAVHD